jgi:hypothetical protein
MTSQVDAYRVRAAEYERKAETMGNGNAFTRAYYQRLAQHWHSLALLAQDRAEREGRLPQPVWGMSKLRVR